MFKTALRNVLAHKARLMMTVLAVTLGVAFVSGTLVFTDTLSKAMSDQSAKSYSGVAVSITDRGPGQEEGVRKEGDPGVSQGTLDKIRALPGVENAAGRVSGFAGVGDDKGKLIGNGWANQGANWAPIKDGQDPRYAFVQGTGPAADNAIALDKDTAERGKYKVGDTVRVAGNGPVREYKLAGVFTTEDGQVNAGGTLVLFTGAEAQKLYLKPGFFTEVSVAAKAGATPEKLLTEVKPLLNKSADAKTGKALAEQQAKSIQDEMKNMSTMLLAFAGISLFVGIFLIYNTFTMLVAQRTKELALLRAVGANRSQVKRSVLTEALVVGVIASVLGILGGIGLALGMRAAIGTFGAKIPAGPTVVSPGTVIIALLVGIVVTLLAAWLPARRTAKISPVAAMGSAHLPATSKSLLLRNIMGSVVFVLGIGIAFLGISAGKDGKEILGGGAFFLMIGLIILLPTISVPVIRAVRPLLEKGFGVSGKLAAQNAVRNPRRTAVTSASLAIGLTMVTTLSVIGVSMGSAIDKMTTANIKADYKVAMAGGFGNMDKSVIPALKGAPGVQAVSEYTSDSLRTDKRYQSATGVDPKGITEVMDVKAVSGSVDSLAQGKAAVTEATAKKDGLKVGSQVPVTFEDGTKSTIAVGAVINDNDLLNGLVLDNKVLAAHSEQQYIPAVYVKMKTGASDANEQALVDALGKNPAMAFSTQEDMRNEMAGMINTMLNVMYGLLGMALIVSVLGVVNTLAMSVYERTQEIGMLRAIGLDRTRVKNMIRLEAVVISLFGAVLGVGIGVFLAWALGRTLAGNISDWEMVLPWGRIGIFLLLAGVVGVLAAMWPARSAAKLNMLTAIKTE
ncbi:ABC transporter permease [Streptomyces sp. BI20]|uniref:ABC transporter permease n=1 Tax=Streptomyces sp. BI20 TaxID=3403460 RepID=UPI003C766DBA